MREEFGYHVKSVSDHAHKELSPAEVYDIFMRDYVNFAGRLTVDEAHYKQSMNGITATVTLTLDGVEHTVTARGNGRLDAVSGAIRSVVGVPYTLDNYSEHAIEGHSSSRAASYVSVRNQEGKSYFGAGIDSDIIVSSVMALVSAVNRMLAADGKNKENNA